jgi:hypothetical protein
MAAPTLTYTLTNGTTADASQVMQNFTDLLNGITDGSKDLSISALSLAGNFTANGTTNTIGNSSSDDLVVTASIASDLAVKTDATYGLGSSSKGYTGIYLGANSQRVRIVPPSGLAASYSLTLPTTAGTAGHSPYNTGSATLSWQPNQKGINAVSSADYTVTDTDAYGTIDVTTGSSNRTVTLPTLADNLGRTITVRKADSGSGYVLVDGESTETINGQTIFYITAQYESVTVVASATEWVVTGFIPRHSPTAPCTAQVTGVTDNYDEVTGCSLTLQPGTWRLGYHLSGRFAASTAVGAIATAMISTASSLAAGATTGVVTDSTQSAEWTNNAAAAANGPINMSCVVTVTITSATTYKLYFRTSNDSTVTAIVRPPAFTGGLTDPDGGTLLWASRVA